ncbi:hypothetical protein AVEN_97490-1 [Araneus ventricosus]|uniref:Uncharacterized protein n=1 Tax=Araneus ventricosus TaxID=182803 RepID=A0A4Y2NQ22_ARAVE|nr:hypothetical protein AVEN_97490-1 [Araneus ventricosus]
MATKGWHTFCTKGYFDGCRLFGVSIVLFRRRVLTAPNKDFTHFTNLRLGTPSLQEKSRWAACRERLPYFMNLYLSAMSRRIYRTYSHEIWHTGSRNGD